MYRIKFYQDKSGKQPVKEYLEALNERAVNVKEDRIKLKKIYEYFSFTGKTTHLF